MHLIYFLLLPMNIPFTWMLPLLTSSLNLILGKKKSAEEAMVTYFSEETTNLGLVIMLAFSGKYIAFSLKVCLGLWSLMHVADIIRENSNEDFVLRPTADAIVYSKVELC